MLCIPNNGYTSKYNIEELEDDGLEENLARECIVQCKPELGKYEDKVFVESVHHQVGISAIVFTTMEEHKDFEVLELTKTKISRSGCLHSFTSCNSDSNISCLNHWYVISSVTN